jgi:hypothetical protein
MPKTGVFGNRKQAANLHEFPCPAIGRIRDEVKRTRKPLRPPECIDAAIERMSGQDEVPNCLDPAGGQGVHPIPWNGNFKKKLASLPRRT